MGNAARDNMLTIVAGDVPPRFFVRLSVRLNKRTCRRRAERRTGNPAAREARALSQIDNG